MNSAMVGMFETRAAAENAKHELVAAGFVKSAVVISDDAPATTTPPSRPVATARAEEEEGAISRFFSSIFGSDEDENAHGDTYKEAIRRGHFGVSVSSSSDEQTDLAESILHRCGAIDVDERSQQWRKEGWAGAHVGATEKTLPNGDRKTLKLVEEDLKVGKRSVARGGVRVFSRVVETPVTETVHLREEHVGVTRNPVNRPATEADFAAFKEGSVEIREMSEQAVVSKDARVVGEVEIGKTATVRDETVRDTVRKTQVDVEKIGTKAPDSVQPVGAKPTKPL